MRFTPAFLILWTKYMTILDFSSKISLLMPCELGLQIYDDHTEGYWEEGGLEFFHMSVDSIIFKQ